MSFRVLYTDRVIFEIGDRIDGLRTEHVGEGVIANWCGQLFDTIESLYDMPMRYPVDRDESGRRGYEVRKLTFRGYVVRYRANTASRTVYVMSFMHGAQRNEARKKPAIHRGLRLGVRRRHRDRTGRGARRVVGSA